MKKSEQFLLLRNRILDHAVQTLETDDAEDWIRTIREDGSWSGIDYDSQAPSNWPPRVHFRRLRVLSVAYADPKNSLFQCRVAAETVKRGVDYWMSREWPNPNWWNVEMLPQQELRYVPLFMGEALGEKRRQAIADILQDTIEPRWTGANRVWFAENVLFKGLLLERGDLIDFAARAMEETICHEWTEDFVPEDGIQPDGCFTQHHVLLYNNGYGAAWLNSSSLWMYLLRGTDFAASREKFEILSGALLDGSRWMQRCGKMDLCSRGREITRKSDGRSPQLEEAVRRLAEAAREEGFPEAEELEELYKHINGGDVPSVMGNRMFWRVDYMCHRRRNYFASVKMLSKGVVGSECILNENKMGGYLSYGMTVFMRDGGEFYNSEGDTGIFPIWDWSHLPGVSAPAVVLSPDETNGMTHTFVGGVSDGRYGAAAMDFGKNIDSGEKFAFGGRKSWFFFDDQVAALGTDLYSTAEEAFDTTVNQCFLRGEVICGGESAERETVIEGKNGGWVHHDGIGYVFPKRTEYVLKTGRQTGCWGRITNAYPREMETPVTGDVFLLTLPHGNCRENISYQYTVLPGKTAEETGRYSENPTIRVLSNSGTVQAVRQEELKITQMIFYRASRCEIFHDCRVTVNEPCLLMLKEEEEFLELWASNPETHGISVDIHLVWKGKKKNLTFKFPEEEAFLGQSLRCRVQL